MDPRPLEDTRRERSIPLVRDPQGAWCVRSSELLGPDGRLAIVHEGASYQLRVTRQNRLILTK